MSSRHSKQLFGHPPGLAICFLTEMWERFSYYGMRALLIFYLTRHFLFSDQVAAGIFGAYISLVYITPVIGGIVADRYLGPGKAVIVGCLLLVAGHFGMAIEGSPIADPDAREGFYLQAFYLSLALIIVGIGFIKANISTIVGSLYEREDPRRDGAYTLFYMGINLGAFFGAIICGLLLEYKGFSWGFGAAGVGMLFGLLVFIRGRPLFQGRDDPPDPAYLREKSALGCSRETCIYLLTAAGVIVVYQLMQFHYLVGGLLSIFLIVMLTLVLSHAFYQCGKVDRDRLLVCVFLMSYQVIFWALFEQAGSSINLLTDRNIDRVVMGYEIPAATFQSANPFFIITLAPLFSIGWLFLARRKQEPSIPAKFALALIQVGLGFLVLVFGAGRAQDPQQVALVWLILMYMLHTTGELCISPIGLSMTSKLSTKKIVGMMMGCWFLAMATGNYISGAIAGMTGSGNLSATAGLAAEENLRNYIEVYSIAGYISIAAGVAALLLVPLLRKGMHGVR
ncbi:MAG: peptide MFS transporter [Pseudohongiellaceae bacterium]